jgi:hypothetical protein
MAPEDQPSNEESFDEIFERLGWEAMEGYDHKTAPVVQSLGRYPDWEMTCPYCGRVNEYGYPACDPVLPRICQGGEE